MAENDTQSLVGTFYTDGEERANVWTHLFGLILAMVGGGWMIWQAWALGPIGRITATVYVSGLLVSFITSVIYHAVPSIEGKRLWRKLDHVGIYYFIAASYMPPLGFVLQRWGLLLFVWLFAAVGIIYKLYFTGRYDRIGLYSYIVMGWVGIVAMPAIWRWEPLIVWWLFAGGAAFMAGILFFVRDEMPYNHAIWHIFVVIGAACHFLAAAQFVYR